MPALPPTPRHGLAVPGAVGVYPYPRPETVPLGMRWLVTRPLPRKLMSDGTEQPVDSSPAALAS